MQAKWITDEVFCGLIPRDVLARKQVQLIREDIHANTHILFRKTFCVKQKGKRYLLRISADDVYKLWINGTFVCAGPAPGYYFHYYYNEIDITDYLVEGKNVIAVHTYYQGLINRVWVSGDDRHGLWLELYEGDKLVLVSDESFLTKRHSGYSTHGEIYGWITQYPEDYDSNAEENGFELFDYDDSNWKSASIRERADYTLFAQPSKLTVHYTEKPKRLTRKGNMLFADFGREIVAYLRVRAKGKQGEKITVLQGEELNDNDSVRFDMRCNCRYEEFWTLSGKEDTLFQFEYKGFRYVELLLPKGVEILSVEAEIRHYPFVEKKNIAPSASVEREVFELCLNTLHYGVQDGFIDCPTREKGQYFGDACYSALSYYAVTGDLSLMELTLDAAFLSCKVEGGMLCYAPASRLDEIAEFSLMIVGLLCCQAILSNDLSYLRKRYQDAVAFMQTYKTRYMDERGLITISDKWNLVDWPVSARDGYDARIERGERCDCHAVLNGYWIAAIRAINHMSDLLGEERLFDGIRTEKAAVSAFYREDKQLFVDKEGSEHSSIGSNAFFLFLGLEPTRQCGENILKMIEKKRLNASNLFISPVIMFALFRCKQNTLLDDLIVDENYWVNMLKEGGTTVFEAFSKEKKYNASLCHPALAFPVLFLAKDEGGEKAGVLKKIVPQTDEYVSRKGGR